ncbi:MAG TPA: zinc-binding dehydrogenase [Candidatus Binataceae bacterium]|nr:zinc-binding dehydrogenase [Candidatus Binataceae bacterium]
MKQPLPRSRASALLSPPRLTQAAILFEVGQPLKIVELSLPSLRTGQVLVEIAYSGVCRSQLLEVRGERGIDRYLPHALGHEGSGVVRGVGPGVSRVKLGDHVVLSWLKGPGVDAAGARYRAGAAVINSGALATFMRHAVVAENRLTRIAPSLDLRAAALLGCAIPTGAGAVLHAAGLKAGASVAVFGCGGVGLSAIAAASLTHARPIIAVDLNPVQLWRARRAGATEVIDATVQAPVAAIQAITCGQGVDCAIEAAGQARAMEAALSSVGEKGICVLAGNLRQGGQIAIDPFDLIRGKRLVGTWGGGTRPARDLPRYARWLRAGVWPLNAMLGRIYRLEEINDAIEDLAAGRGGRGLIAMDPQATPLAN